MNRRNFRNDTPLHLAAKRGDQETLMLLIDSGAKLGCPNCDKGKPCEMVDEKAAAFIREQIEKKKERDLLLKKEAEEAKKKKKKEVRFLKLSLSLSFFFPRNSHNNSHLSRRRSA